MQRQNQQVMQMDGGGVAKNSKGDHLCDVPLAMLIP